MKSILQMLRDESGPTAVEYAVLLALLLSAMVAAVTFVGSEIREISQDNVQALDGALTRSESNDSDRLSMSGVVTEGSGATVDTLTVVTSVALAATTVAWLASRATS